MTIAAGYAKVVRPAFFDERPPAFEACFDLLSAADQEAPFALFGGAVRDARCQEVYGLSSDELPINDYDFRVQLPGDIYFETRKLDYVRELGRIAGTKIEKEPSAGTGIIRYCLEYADVQLDISIRPIQSKIEGAIIQGISADETSPSARVAQERVFASAMGISSVAIAGDRTLWESPEHASDLENRTLSLYPIPNAVRRLSEYAEHMQGKFPCHELRQLPPNDRGLY